jgi:hypothetical protein
VLDHRGRDRPQMRERGGKRGVGRKHEWQTLRVPLMFRHDLQQVKRFERPDPGVRRTAPARIGEERTKYVPATNSELFAFVRRLGDS